MTTDTDEPRTFRIADARKGTDLSWLENRLKDLIRRVQTIKAVQQTAVNATDENSVEGRHERQVLRKITAELTELSQAMLDLEDLKHERDMSRRTP